MLFSPCQPDLPKVMNFCSSGCISHNVPLFRLREWQDLGERKKKEVEPDFHLFQTTSFQLTQGLGKAILLAAPCILRCNHIRVLIVIEDVPGVPNTMPRFNDLLGGHRTQPIIIFMVVIYYSGRIQNNIRKEKMCLRQSLKETKCKFLRVRSHQITQDALDSTSKMVTTCIKCFPGSSLETQCPGFYWELVMKASSS